MIISWMLDAIVFTLFLGIAAMAAERLRRDLGRQGRWPWVGALVTATLWPLPAFNTVPANNVAEFIAYAKSNLRIIFDPPPPASALAFAGIISDCAANG